MTCLESVRVIIIVVVKWFLYDAKVRFASMSCGSLSGVLFAVWKLGVGPGIGCVVACQASRIYQSPPSKCGMHCIESQDINDFCVETDGGGCD